MRAIRCRSFLLLRRDGVWDEYHGRLIHSRNELEFHLIGGLKLTERI